MNDFKILTDSCSDIPDEILNEIDVDIIPFYTCLDGKKYLKERVDISTDEFYRQLQNENTVFPKTSFPPVSEFIDFFLPYLEKNIDIIYFSMTAKFSGVFAAITNIVQNLKEEYPKNNIILIDSMMATIAEGLLVIEATKMKKAGHSIFQIADFINNTKAEAKLFCTINSLSHLQKGGRIGKVAAITGSLLNIKPIIEIKDGELHPYSKIRGRKKAMEEITKLIAEHTQKNNYEYAVCHSCSYDEATEIINILQNNFGIKAKLPPIQIGTTIGSHIGPTALAVTAVKKFSKMN